MLNLKYIELPILVGLLAGRVRATGIDDYLNKGNCKFNVTESATGYSCEANAFCYDKENVENYSGYYLPYIGESSPGEYNTDTFITVNALSKSDFLLFYNGTTESCSITNLPIPGYYKNKMKDVGTKKADGSAQTVDGEYIECDSTGCKLIAKPIETTCISNVGKLIKKTVGEVDHIILCLNDNVETGTLDFTSADETNKDLNPVKDGYLIAHNPNTDPKAMFNIEMKANYYAVKADTQSIVFDVNYQIENLCMESTTNKIISRIEDFCNANSSGNYYTCKYGVCDARNEATNAVSSNGETSLTGNNCTFECEIDKPTGKTEYLVKQCNYKEGTCNQGYYLLKNEINTVGETKSVSSTSIIGSSTEIGNDDMIVLVEYKGEAPATNILAEKINISGSDFYEDPVSGYYKNGDTREGYASYIACNDSKCELIAAERATSCVGKSSMLIDDGYEVVFCISNTEHKKITDSGELMVSGNSNNKAGMAIAANYYKVKITTNKSYSIDTTYDDITTIEDVGYLCVKGVCAIDKCKLKVSGGGSVKSCTVDPKCSYIHANKDIASGSRLKWNSPQIVDGLNRRNPSVTSAFFVDANNGAIITSINENTKGYLVKLTATKTNSEIDDVSKFTYDNTCKVVTDKDGYYKNVDRTFYSTYKLMKCESGGCELIKPTKNEVKYFINAQFVATDKSDDEEKYKIIKYEVSNCNNCISEVTYVLNSNVLTKYVNGDKDLSLISCGTTTNTACEIMKAETYSYYVSKESNDAHITVSDGQLIYCNEKECLEKSGGSGSTYYIDKSNTKNIITCTGNLSNTCFTGAGRNYYIDSDKLDNLGLIYCANNKCSSVPSINRGVYLGSEDNVIIKCVNGCVYSDPITLSDTNLNDYYINGGEDKSSRPIIYVKKTENSTRKRSYSYKYDTKAATANAVYINKNGSNLVNALIYCSTTSSCKEITPGNNEKYIQFVENDKIGIISCINPACSPNLINASSITSDFAYYFDSSSGRIITDNKITGSLLACTFTAGSTIEENKYSCILQTSNINNYYLNKDDDTLIVKNDDGSLSLVKTMDNGYYINSSNKIILCINNKCKYNSSADCGASTITDWGKMTASGELCIPVGTSNSGKSSIKGNKYIITIPINVLKVQDDIGAGSYLFKIESKKITIPKRSVSEYYITDKSSKQVIKTTSEGDLYECKNDNKCIKQNNSVYTADVYYLNGDIDTVATYRNIKCSKDKSYCSLSKPDENDVYCLKENKLQVCKDGCEESCHIQKAVIGTGRYYLSTVNNNELIECSGEENCTKKTVKAGYYLSQDLSKPLILCNASMGSEFRCSYASAKVGLYNSAEGKPIHCDNNKICKKVDTPGWYVSGESDDFPLTYCRDNGVDHDHITSCTSYPSPALGYYVNGFKEEGKLLISCTKKSTIECTETAVPNIGYYINADNINDEPNKIINCSKTGCEVINSNGSEIQPKYFVNGSNNQLIICNNLSCSNVNISSKGWYLSGNKLIGCIKSGSSYVCSENDASSLPKGYYLNSDSYTSYKPIIQNNGSTFSTISAENGWYINADPANEASDKIIRCSSDTKCSTKDIKNKVCSVGLNGEFTSYYGANDLRYCNNEEAISLNSNSQQYITFTTNDLIPGVNLPESVKVSSAIAVIAITNSYGIKITQKRMTGYSLDETNNVLYQCKDIDNGVCIIVNKPTDGFYINETEEKLYKCRNLIFENISIGDQDAELATLRNVIKVNDGFKICTGNEKILLSQFKLKEIYAIENIGESFGSNSDYVMVSVDQYSVLLVNYIKEITIVDNVKVESNAADNKVVLKKGGTLYKVKSGDPVTEEEVMIDMEEKINAIEYDYDTKNGYFVYKKTDGTPSMHKLNEVYISIDEDEKYYRKYYCKIGGLCVIQVNQNIKPIKYFELSEDGVLKTQNTEGNESIYTEKIKKGSYMMSNGKMAECDSDGTCVSKNLPSKVKFVNNLLTFNDIVASKLHKKFVFFRRPENSLHKRDENEISVDGLIELTSASYTQTDYTTRNIFVDENNVPISDGNESINKGYCCIDSKCKEISNSGVTKYYLNTVQIGKFKNEIVKCGFDTGTFKCKFIPVNTSIIYENAASTSSEDALISCDTKNGCSIIADETKGGGLPLCKSEDGDAEEIYSIFTACINSNTNIELLEGQHCILNKKIYKSQDSSCDLVEDKQLLLFDVAYRELEYKKVEEDHINASMYYCKEENECVRTYGYLYKDTNQNKYAICNKLGCTMKESNQSTDCSILRAGSFVSGGKFCQSSKTTSNEQRSLTDTTKYYVPVEIDSNGIFPETTYGDKILVGVNNNAAYMVIADGYILLGKSNNALVISEISDNNGTELYMCSKSSKNCVKSAINNGYYKRFVKQEIIKCGNNADGTCSILANINYYKKFTEEKTYEYYDTKSADSSFPGTNLPVLVERTKYKMNILKTNGYILLANDKLATPSVVSNNLYLCNSKTESCIKKEISDNQIKAGWYVNGDGIYKVIKCEEVSTTYKCNVVNGELPKSCSNDGDFIYKDSSYQFCYENGKSSPLTMLSGNAYQLSNNKFPSGKDYVAVSIYAVQGIGKIGGGLKFNGLPKCTNTNSNAKCKINEYINNKAVNKELDNDEYCIFNNEKIYKTNSGKCNQQYTQDVGSVYLFNYKKLVTSENTPTDGTQMFYCKKGICRIASGYYTIGAKWYRCDSVGCKDVVSGIENGQLNSSNQLNCGKNNGKSNTGSDKHTYYYITGSNDFPGAESSNDIMVETGKDYFINFKGDGYYLIHGTNNEMLVEDTYVASTRSQRDNIAVDINKRGVSKRDSNNNLFLCDSSNGSCIKQGINIHGYFINAGASQSNLAIIGCYGSEGCKLADNTDIGFLLNKCDDTYVGRVIRLNNSTNTNYKICISKTNAQDLKTNNSVNTKYYQMTLDNGANFAGISIDKKDENADVTANIIVRIDNRSIIQYTGEGYILFNNNDIMTNINSSGSLYYCENKEYLKNDASTTTVQCNAVTTVNNGVYKMNLGDNRYIRCQDKQCKIQEALISNECRYSGQMIFSDNELKLCQTEGKQIKLSEVNEYKAIMNVSYMDEFPGVRANNTEIIVNIGKDYVTSIKLDTYMVVETDNTIIDEENVYGTLYKCTNTNGGCVKDTIPYDNYYIKSDFNGNPIDLIKCESNSKCTVLKNKSKVKEGFYVSASISKPIIQCIQPGKEIEGRLVYDEEKDIIQCFEREFKEGYLMNAAKEIYEDKINYPLIECNIEKGCVEMYNPNNGWYVNLGADKIFDQSKFSNSTVNPFITCNSSSCTYYEDEISKDCTTGGGKLVISGTYYNLCRDDKVNNSVQFTKLGNDAVAYQIVSVVNNNDFPDVGSDSLILAIVNKNRIIQQKNEGYYYKDSILYKCSANGSCEKVLNEGYYYEKLTNQIMTGSCKETSCTWSIYNKEGYIFLNDNKLVTSNVEINISNVYQCKKNSSRKLLCFEIVNPGDGYYYNLFGIDNNKRTKTFIYKREDSSWTIESDTQKCTYVNYKNNVCTISYTNEKEYNSYNSNNYKISAGGICVTDAGKYYFALNEINTGIDKVNCIAMPTDDVIYHYKINNKIYDVEKIGVRIVDNNYYINSMDSSYVFNNENVNGIWNEGNMFDDNTITCEDGICISEKTVSCDYNFQTGKCKLASGTINIGQTCVSSNEIRYIAIEKLSNSAYGNCVTYKTKNDKTLSDLNNVDTNSKLYNVDGKIYKINSSKINIIKEGIYIIDKANYNINSLSDINKEFDISNQSYYDIYVCSENGCEVKIACNYENDYEYMYDKNNKNLIRCNPENQTVKMVNSPGYYINSPNKKLVKCYNDRKCKEIGDDTGMEGYYVDAGNEGKMIVCKRENGKFSCDEEDTIECDYNESEGTCQSKQELKRNSYCYYSVEEKIIGKVEKLLYIENFIKAGEIGECIFAGVKNYYYMYDDSKFLDNEKRTDLIKVSSDSIVSIFEKNIGYYIINTKEGLGITENVHLKKTRLYECTSNGCKENRKPKEYEIYVNKASTEKLVQFRSNEWNIINNGCEIDENNRAICNLETKTKSIEKDSLIYIEKNDELNIYGLRLGINGKTPVDFHYKIIGKSYYKRPEDNNLYYFNEDKQSLSRLSDNGYYFLQKYKEDDDEYIYSEKFNLVPYKKTINETNSDNLYVYNQSGNYDNSENLLGTKGFYWNRADVEKEGLAMMYMQVPVKKPVEISSSRKRENTSTDPKYVFKAIINKCTSTKRNVCVGTEDRSIINGSVCVVTDGDYKGIYLVTGTVTKASTTVNCIKYNSGVVNSCSYTNGVCKSNGATIPKGSYCVTDKNAIYYANEDITSESDMSNCNIISNEAVNTYQYVSGKIEFAGQLISKNIIEVRETEILPFDDDYDKPTEDVGYFVYDDNKFKFTSTIPKSTSNAYQCRVRIDLTADQQELKSYECVVMNNPKEYYYYDNKNNNVLYVSNNKWKVETNYGYYFFNSDDLAASIRKVGENDIKDDENEIKVRFSSRRMYNGRYINSAATNTMIFINYVNDESSGTETYQFIDDVKYCSINKDGTCKPAVATDIFSTGDICYNPNTKKLYVVDIVPVEQQVEGGESINKIMCYTGNEIKYRYALLNDFLYSLDGLSVQEMENGYYLLDENWEEFSSNYPETPYKIIYCESRKCEVVTSISTNADVVINRAGTGNNKLMKYYNDSVKFVNAYKPGLYFISNEEKIENVSYSNTYMVNENGELSENGYCGNYDICLNYADPKRETMIQGNSYYVDNKITYNSDLDCIEYDGKHNLDETKSVYIYHNNYLFLLLQKKLKHVDVNQYGGIYAIVDGKAFDSDEWTTLSGNEICYYNYGSCNSENLNIYRKYKYVLNYATKYEYGVPSILEYNDDKDQWRTVKENGIYFFFVDNYSITLEDRRIEAIYEVVNGVVKNITNDFKKSDGIYLFDNMIVKNDKNGLRDGRMIVPNVEFKTKRKCFTFETDETINIDEFCYGDGLGICAAKTIIMNNSNENNCMFSDVNEPFYFALGNSLYMFNKQFLKKISGSGLYVLNSNGDIFDSMVESDALAYKCEKGKCTLNKSQSSGYYINAASESNEIDIILYNEDSKTWIKSKDEGIFFFNEDGSAVAEGEKNSRGYVVKNNGKDIHIVKQTAGIKYISMSNPNSLIVMTYNNEWSAKEIAKCSMDESGVIRSNTKLVEGDLCIDEEIIIMITSVNTKEKRDNTEDNEITYTGIKSTTSGGENQNKYYYLSDKKELVIFKDNSVVPVSVTGTIIIDNVTYSSLESVTEVDATAYDCKENTCEIIEDSNLTTKKYYINELSKDNKLVKYVGNGKWKIENVNGFYFFDSKVDAVSKDGINYAAFEISTENGSNVQTDITERRKIGLFFNKAIENKIIVSNNGQYWSKGNDINKCNVTIVEDGILCKTTKNGVIYESGQYCYKESTNQIYLLTGEANFVDERPNCIYGTNEEPRYVFSSEIGGVLNKVALSNQLIKLDNEAISVVKSGYYTVDQNGHIINNNDDENTELTIYKCGDEGCAIENNMEEDIIFLTSKGEMYKMVDTKLKSVNDTGIYFFNEEGMTAATKTDEVATIIQVINGEKNAIDLNALDKGVYVNAGDKKSVAVYDGENWTIEAVECEFNKDSNTCSNYEIELNIGSYCVVDGKLYVIHKIDEEKDEKYCIAGQNKTPILINNAENKLMKVKETEINYVTDEGYYAIEANKSIALISETPVESKFIECVFGGECEEVIPTQGSYLNRSPEKMNIVQFPTGEISKAQAINNECTVESNVCTITDPSKELNDGDLCVANSSLYLIASDRKCIMAEKDIITFQIVNNKLFRVGQDAVLQMKDGYFFVNSENKSIKKVSEYSLAGVKGYICSVKGECYELAPTGVHYYPDYNTMNNNKYKVVKYDDSSNSKRDESSGYEILKEEGIIKLDDGSYTECELDNNDEITCHNIEESGSYMTNDEELIVCKENDNEKVECSQAIEGGYYIVNGELMECEPNADKDELICEKMDKEGYFLSKPSDTLYECIQKKKENESQKDVRRNHSREDANSSTNVESSSTANANGEDNQEINEPTMTSTVSEESTSTVINTPTSTPTPLDVTCEPVECVFDKIIGFDNEEGTVQMYICTKVESTNPEEEGENKWIAGDDCESGNFIKDGEYYTCEEEKENVPKENIDKPNQDKTVDTSNPQPTTKKPTTTTTTKSEATITTTTTIDNTTSIDNTTTSKTKSTSKTTSKSTSSSGGADTATKTTTKSTTKPASPTNTNESGASSLLRNIPPYTFYLLLFIFTYILLN